MFPLDYIADVGAANSEDKLITYVGLITIELTQTAWTQTINVTAEQTDGRQTTYDRQCRALHYVHHAVKIQQITLKHKTKK